MAKNPEVTRQILISNYDDVKSETLRPYEAVAFYERERADEIFKPLGYHFFLAVLRPASG